jgi:hypothetical protein
MTRSRFTAWLIAVLAPLALGLLSVDASLAAAGASAAPAGAMASMPGCDGPAHKSAPAKTTDCARHCPLLCAATLSPGPGLDAPVRPYARLRYEASGPGRDGQGRDPQHPPPRTVQT